ncbi:MAG: hypothetical protein R8G60_01995 [Roseovarius pacificus]|nr:hypothetical protein [Roseovarius pacificus]
MIELLEPTFTLGADPEAPVASDLALEASVTEAKAASMLSSAWAQVEAFTGKTYRATLGAVIIIRVVSPMAWQWPRYPYPEDLTIEAYSQGAWVPWSEIYIPYAGLIELEPFTLYRLSHTTTTPGATVTPAVEQAVYNLALYQLIQSPGRREFQSQTAGDSGLTRERLMPIFQGSGAGALLAGEIRI